MSTRTNTVSRLAMAATMLPTSLMATGNADGAWALLESIQTEEIETATDWHVAKIFPSEMKDGIAQFDISGFAVPLYGDGAVREFILVSNMGFCPFCGDPDHGTSLTVELDVPLDTLEDGQPITVRGALEPVRDPGTMMTAIMRRAQILTD